MMNNSINEGSTVSTGEKAPENVKTPNTSDENDDFSVLVSLPQIFLRKTNSRDTASEVVQELANTLNPGQRLYYRLIHTMDYAVGPLEGLFNPMDIHYYPFEGTVSIDGSNVVEYRVSLLKSFCACCTEGNTRAHFVHDSENHTYPLDDMLTFAEGATVMKSLSTFFQQVHFLPHQSPALSRRWIDDMQRVFFLAGFLERYDIPFDRAVFLRECKEYMECMETSWTEADWPETWLVDLAHDALDIVLGIGSPSSTTKIAAFKKLSQYDLFVPILNKVPESRFKLLHNTVDGPETIIDIYRMCVCRVSVKRTRYGINSSLTVTICMLCTLFHNATAAIPAYIPSPDPKKPSTDQFLRWALIVNCVYRICEWLITNKGVRKYFTKLASSVETRLPRSEKHKKFEDAFYSAAQVFSDIGEFRSEAEGDAPLCLCNKDEKNGDGAYSDIIGRRWKIGGFDWGPLGIGNGCTYQTIFPLKDLINMDAIKRILTNNAYVSATVELHFEFTTTPTTSGALLATVHLAPETTTAFSGFPLAGATDTIARACANTQKLHSIMLAGGNVKYSLRVPFFNVDHMIHSHNIPLMERLSMVTVEELVKLQSSSATPSPIAISVYASFTRLATRGETVFEQPGGGRHPLQAEAGIEGTSYVATDRALELSPSPNPSVGRIGTDDCTIDHVSNSWTLVDIREMTSDDAPGQILAEYNVTPFICVANTTGNQIQPASCAIPSLFFEYWRGGMQYKIQVVGPAIAAGRLAVMYDPLDRNTRGKWTPIETGAKDLHEDYNEHCFLDCATDLETKFDIGYSSAESGLNTMLSAGVYSPTGEDVMSAPSTGIHPSRGNGATGDWLTPAAAAMPHPQAATAWSNKDLGSVTCHSGRFAIKVISPVTSNDGSALNISVLLFARCAPDMKYWGYTGSLPAGYTPLSCPESKGVINLHEATKIATVCTTNSTPSPCYVPTPRWDTSCASERNGLCSASTADQPTQELTAPNGESVTVTFGDDGSLISCALTTQAPSSVPASFTPTSPPVVSSAPVLFSQSAAPTTAQPILFYNNQGSVDIPSLSTSAPTKRPTYAPTQEQIQFGNLPPDLQPTDPPTRTPTTNAPTVTFAPTRGEIDVNDLTPSMDIQWINPDDYPPEQQGLVDLLNEEISDALPTSGLATVLPDDLQTIFNSVGQSVWNGISSNFFGAPPKEGEPPPPVPPSFDAMLELMAKHTQVTPAPTSMFGTVTSYLPSIFKSSAPTVTPTEGSTDAPSVVQFIGPKRFKPTSTPSVPPTIVNTLAPTKDEILLAPPKETSQPSAHPSDNAMLAPPKFASPSGAPVIVASVAPSSSSIAPSDSPSETPTDTSAPSGLPTGLPSRLPSRLPTGVPTGRPSLRPSKGPTGEPTPVPTGVPTNGPTSSPTAPPSSAPSTASPTAVPTQPPTGPPTRAPTGDPSRTPTQKPTLPPTVPPTDPPTGAPSKRPSEPPSQRPTSQAPTTQAPSTTSPTTAVPSASPTTSAPTPAPTGVPSTVPPTSVPPVSGASLKPTPQPSTWPASLPATIVSPDGIGLFENISGMEIRVAVSGPPPVGEVNLGKTNERLFVYLVPKNIGAYAGTTSHPFNSGITGGAYNARFTQSEMSGLDHPPMNQYLAPYGLPYSSLGTTSTVISAPEGCDMTQMMTSVKLNRGTLAAEVRAKSISAVNSATIISAAVTTISSYRLHNFLPALSSGTLMRHTFPVSEYWNPSLAVEKLLRIGPTSMMTKPVQDQWNPQQVPVIKVTQTLPIPVRPAPPDNVLLESRKFYETFIGVVYSGADPGVVQRYGNPTDYDPFVLPSSPGVINSVIVRLPTNGTGWGIVPGASCFIYAICYPTMTANETDLPPSLSLPYGYPSLASLPEVSSINRRLKSEAEPIPDAGLGMTSEPGADSGIQHDPKSSDKVHLGDDLKYPVKQQLSGVRDDDFYKLMQVPSLCFRIKTTSTSIGEVQSLIVGMYDSLSEPDRRSLYWYLCMSYCGIKGGIRRRYSVIGDGTVEVRKVTACSVNRDVGATGSSRTDTNKRVLDVEVPYSFNHEFLLARGMWDSANAYEHVTVYPHSPANTVFVNVERSIADDFSLFCFRGACPLQIGAL